MWEILQTDFGGDETVNFGPRKEAGTALFQIDTIATLSCQDEVWRYKISVTITTQTIPFPNKPWVRIHQPFFRMFFVLFSRFFYS